MAIGNRDVEIKQNFQLRGGSFATPRLVPCLVGILKEYVRKEKVGSYDGGGVGNIDTDFPFPSTIRVDSNVIKSSVRVYLDSRVSGLIEIPSTDFVVTQQGVTLPPDVQLEIALINNGSGISKLYKDGSDYIIEDPNINFISSGVFGDVVNGDLVTIPGFSVSYIISEVVETHKIKVILTGDLLAEFASRPDRVFTSVTYDVDRIVTVGPDSNNLLLTSDLFISLDAVRNDKAGVLNKVSNSQDIEELGIKSMDNEVAWSASILNQSRESSFFYVTVAEHTTDEHAAALDLMASEELYYLTPLTTNKSITNLYKAHVDDLSLPVNKKERRAYYSSEFVDFDEKIIDNTGECIKTGNFYNVLDSLGEFQSRGVEAGDVVEFKSSTDGQDIVGEYKVTSVISQDELQLFGNLKNFLVRATDGKTSRNGSSISSGEILTPISTAITNGDTVFLEIKSDDNVGNYEVLSVVGSDINLVNPPVGGFAPNVGVVFNAYVDALSITGGQTLIYSIKTEDFDSQGKSDYMKGIGFSISDRRVSLVMPGAHSFSHEIFDDEGNKRTEEVTNASGWAMAVAVVALRFSRAPQIPMTGESILSANTTTAHKIFTDPQLTNMQRGGVMVIQTEGNSPNAYIRQLLTTDVSDIIFQEVTIQESVDFFAKMLREELRPIMGRVNLDRKTIDFLRIKVETIVEKTTIQNGGDGPMFGPLTELLELIISENCPDTLKLDIKIDPLFPFNAADIELFI